MSDIGLIAYRHTYLLIPLKLGYPLVRLLQRPLVRAASHLVCVKHLKTINCFRAHWRFLIDHLICSETCEGMRDVRIHHVVVPLIP